MNTSMNKREDLQRRFWKMKKVSFFILGAFFLLISQSAFSQEKFIDVRQKMADSLTSLKAAVKNNHLDLAISHFQKARQTWQQEVKPLVVEGVKTDEQYREYFNRMDEVEKNLNDLGQLLENNDDDQIESRVNAIIWGISHHPRGFDVPEPKYSLWDWVFALGIGIGFCIFAIFAGLYLRRSYYRRYKHIYMGK